MPRLMVIDDSRLAALSVKRCLEGTDVEVVHGKTATEVFGFKGQPSLLRDAPPDVILLDLLMPDMNGLDVLTKLKAMVRVKDIPVIMVSSSSSETNVEESMHRGAECFLSKPLDKEKLITQVIKSARSVGATEMVNALLPLESEQSKKVRVRSEHKIGRVDMGYLLEILDDDQEILKDLVNVFVQDLPEMLNSVERAVKEEDAKALRFSAHLLKGSLSNFGVNEITAQALQLEVMGRDKELDDVAAIYGKMASEALELRNELIAWLAFK